MLALVAALALGSASGLGPLPGGELRIETDYSSVILRDRGFYRALYFVRDSGEEVVESIVNLAAPHVLVVPYTRRMFGSYLFVRRPTKVLVVGLGAGSMVRFLERYDPEVEIVAIDIDPEIVAIAERDFGTRPGPRVRIEAADGFAFVRDSTERFDVVYMDAFLKPSEATDSTGAPLALKTAGFYAQLKARLTADGAVVFNLNSHEGLDDDLAGIGASFRETFVLDVPRSGVVIAIATKRASPRSTAELRAAAEEAEARLGAGLGLPGFLADLRPLQR